MQAKNEKNIKEIRYILSLVFRNEYGNIFEVKKSFGKTLRINWVDGPPVKEVKKLTGAYVVKIERNYTKDFLMPKITAWALRLGLPVPDADDYAVFSMSEANVFSAKKSRVFDKMISDISAPPNPEITLSNDELTLVLYGANDNKYLYSLEDANIFLANGNKVEFWRYNKRSFRAFVNNPAHSQPDYAIEHLLSDDRIIIDKAFLDLLLENIEIDPEDKILIDRPGCGLIGFRNEILKGASVTCLEANYIYRQIIRDINAFDGPALIDRSYDLIISMPDFAMSHNEQITNIENLISFLSKRGLLVVVCDEGLDLVGDLEKIGIIGFDEDVQRIQCFSGINKNSRRVCVRTYVNQL